MSYNTPRANSMKYLQYISGMYQSGEIDIDKSTELSSLVSEGSRSNDFSKLFESVNTIYQETKSRLARMLLDELFVG